MRLTTEHLRSVRRLGAGLFLGLAIAACGPAKAPAPTEPALWRIADADSEIWLFGTSHVLRPDQQWRGPRFERAFASASELVLETDAGPQNQATFTALAQRDGTLPPGETLSARLDENQRAQLARVAAAAHVDPQALEHERPWLAALQLSVATAAAHGEAADAGVESVLLRDAQRNHTHLSYLETPEEQILTLADLPAADETRFLVASLHQMEEDHGADDSMELAWASGDVTTLSRLLDAQLREAGPAAYDALITRRNAQWADEIARRLNGSGHVFIAVGAAHLVGSDSVVALLRARGIAVEGP